MKKIHCYPCIRSIFTTSSCPSRKALFTAFFVRSFGRILASNAFFKMLYCPRSMNILNFFAMYSQDITFSLKITVKLLILYFYPMFTYFLLILSSLRRNLKRLKLPRPKQMSRAVKCVLFLMSTFTLFLYKYIILNIK